MTALALLTAASAVFAENVWPKEFTSTDVVRIRYGAPPAEWQISDKWQLSLARIKYADLAKGDKRHTFTVRFQDTDVEAFIEYSLNIRAEVMFDVDAHRFSALKTQEDVLAYHKDWVPDYYEGKSTRTQGTATLGGKSGYRVTDTYVVMPRPEIWETYREGGYRETKTTYVVYVKDAPVVCRVNIEAGINLVDHTPRLGEQADTKPLIDDAKDLEKTLRSEADAIVASISLAAPGEEFAEPAPAPAPDKPAGNNWVVVVGGVAAVGAAAAAIAAAAKALAGVKKPGSSPKHDDAPVGYILQLSSKKLSVAPDKPATLTVKAWKVGADGVPKAAPEARVSIEAPASAGLSVTPPSGHGELSASISVNGVASAAQITLTISAEVGGGRVSDTVSVESQSGMALEFF